MQELGWRWARLQMRLKQPLPWVAPDVESDGVAAAIEQFILI